MKLELLAPAGSIAGMKAVIAAGADAVYIGGSRFGARAYAENPNEEELVRAIRYAHLRGVRVYLTVNTLLRDEELAELPAWLSPYVAAGLDAVLVQDLGVLRLLRREFPHLTIHASTQMTVTGPEGAMLLRDLGVSRVVPAREMSLSELSRIHEKSGLEVEAFVHGALCVCFSGQCLFSSLLGGRSGNRGRCAQPCRLTYRFGKGWSEKAGQDKDARSKGKETSNKYPQAEKRGAQKKTFQAQAEGELLSPKDLCALDILPAMAAAGVVSFKIEGRMKQPAYAAGVTAVYRKYLDLIGSGKPYRVDPADRERLYTLFNRGGFTDGYFTRRNGPEMMTRKGRVLTGAEEKARAELYAEMDGRYVFPEDAVGIYGKARIFAGQDAELTVSLADFRGALANAGSAERGCGAETANIPSGVRGCGSESANILSGMRSCGAEAVNEDKGGESGAVFIGQGSRVSANVYGEEVLPARNAPLTEERIREQLTKTGGSGFVFRALEVSTDGNSFLPAKSLNELRRKALAALEEEILREYVGDADKESGPSPRVTLDARLRDSGEGRRNPSKVPDDPGEEKKMTISAICDTLPQAFAAKEGGADRIFLDAAALYTFAEAFLPDSSYTDRSKGCSAKSGEAQKSSEDRSKGSSAKSGEVEKAIFSKDESKVRSAKSGEAQKTAEDRGEGHSAISGEAQDPSEEGRALLEAAWRLSGDFGSGRLWIATPLAERAGAADALYEQAEAMLAAGIGGFLARSFEGFAHINRLGLAESCVADAAVYTWNQEAKALAEELGFAGTAAPYELSKAQLSRRNQEKTGLSEIRESCGEPLRENTAASGALSDPADVRGRELTAPADVRGRELTAPADVRGRDGIVSAEKRARISEIQIYGRQTLMVTAQCLRKNSSGCTKRPGLETLADRTGAVFPVRCNCTFCSNIIYNSVPHSLFREIGFFKKQGFTSLRLAFTTEAPEEVKRLVRTAAASVRDSAAVKEEPVPQYTRGQFSKGVE